jgi:hypothetical protein
MEKTHTTFEGLPAEWRKRAEYLRAYGDSTSAKLWTLAADELEQSIAAHGLETLPLGDAARLSGYTADHLGQLVRSGRMKNYGREGAPRIRRADLPNERLTVSSGRHARNRHLISDVLHSLL